jgi:hypothetical protein
VKTLQDPAMAKRFTPILAVGGVLFLAAAAAHYDYYLVEAYDQPWKAAAKAL